MHGDPNIFSEAYVAATLREAKRDRAFYRAYFEKFGTAELEKGYQTLFENVFKPFSAARHRERALHGISF